MILRALSLFSFSLPRSVMWKLCLVGSSTVSLYSGYPLGRNLKTDNAQHWELNAPVSSPWLNARFQGLPRCRERRLARLYSITQKQHLWDQATHRVRITWSGAKKEQGYKYSLKILFLKVPLRGFPGGTVVEDPPADAGDTGSNSGLGGSHVPRSD